MKMLTSLQILKRCHVTLVIIDVGARDALGHLVPNKDILKYVKRIGRKAGASLSLWYKRGGKGI